MVLQPRKRITGNGDVSEEASGFIGFVGRKNFYCQWQAINGNFMKLSLRFYQKSHIISSSSFQCECERMKRKASREMGTWPTYRLSFLVVFSTRSCLFADGFVLVLSRLCMLNSHSEWRDTTANFGRQRLCFFAIEIPIARRIFWLCSTRQEFMMMELSTEMPKRGTKPQKSIPIYAKNGNGKDEDLVNCLCPTYQK